ncbi:L-serine ammonia-lyase, iron-sulfur-dependent subunit beta [Ruminococcus sp. 5_1_39BFAA]|uniref:L-serine ammonia-lyase, iron-sulfur-dependent subunit beta n=1 Tax=Ruminococcus sp. 5_1_39BFAA TaxID=457412 RepID=UPI00356461D1
MEFISVFDVIGPNMIGPSSSHTAGAVRIALLAGKMMHHRIVKADFILYKSFAETYRGHGTDRALVGGILGFKTDNPKIRDSLEIAEKQGLAVTFSCNREETDCHPNTVDIAMEDELGYRLTVRGESLGGGKARITRINGVNVVLTGEYSSLLVVHTDYPGVLAHITDVLSSHHVNIAFLRLFRREKGGETYTIIESDDPVSAEAVADINKNQYIRDTIVLKE